MVPTKCSKLNLYCFVCGHYVPQRSQKGRDAQKNKQYYGIDLCESSWTPDKMYQNCSSRMYSWMKGVNISMPFGEPVIWKEDEHGHDESRCYGCLNSSHGMDATKMKHHVYKVIIPQKVSHGNRFNKLRTIHTPEKNQNAKIDRGKKTFVHFRLICEKKNCALHMFHQSPLFM